MRYQTRMGQLIGDPGLFGSIGSILGKVAGVAKIIPGIGTAVSIASGAISLGSSLLGRPTAAAPGGGVRVPTVAAARGGAAKKKGYKTGVSPLGTYGERRLKHRRMNAGNAKAARRSIRRIKAVRHLLQSIERELPHRKAVARGGSPGVITRREAMRALAS